MYPHKDPSINHIPRLMTSSPTESTAHDRRGRQSRRSTMRRLFFMKFSSRRCVFFSARAYRSISRRNQASLETPAFHITKEIFKRLSLIMYVTLLARTRADDATTKVITCASSTPPPPPDLPSLSPFISRCERR